MRNLHSITGTGHEAIDAIVLSRMNPIDFAREYQGRFLSLHQSRSEQDVRLNFDAIVTYVRAGNVRRVP